ncbi:MAG TPA: nitroreductase family protein [Termitinemataceae bacterium]|uniref:nitroreductase family protein n=1 Tax=Treponema sp. J25 TaxID=2094121 RepID=UPI00104696AB|nr:nitroreductase family protein [Treponema sp. J25]TCW60880.1 nitroreductase [Treponema sp. J25]HOJ99661.1 nitroreductase family protein [Termitinemataceae bacterium]HOM23827.1 nitroreductase family protein [Termitinemataceae bacterium]HPQ00903.1 nitroreductase family protein [Termitinemataceae bacterium]
MLVPAIENRRAYRAISSEALPEGALDEILRAGTLAPSCYNNQPWHLVVAQGQTLQAVHEALSEGNAWARKAPVIVALVTRPCDDCRLDDGRDYAHFDLGLCAMNMMIQATHLGLVAHPIAGFNPKKVRSALGIPKDYDVVSLLVIGQRGDPAHLEEWQKKAETGPRDRKSLDQVVHWNKW